MNIVISWKSDQKYQSYRCIKNCIKMWMKTCFHSHFMQFFMSFYGKQLKQLYTSDFLYVFFNPLKWQSSSSFPNLMVQMSFSPNSTGPGPDFKKVGKFLSLKCPDYDFNRKQVNKYISSDLWSQLVTCLTADPGVTSLIQARSHTFAEIGHEINSTTILLPSTDSRSTG